MQKKEPGWKDKGECQRKDQKGKRRECEKGPKRERKNRM